MRVLIDYRSALRGRSGTGEYIHELAAALARCPVSGSDAIAVTVFSSSWKDRLPSSRLPGVARVDRRIPVSLLNLAWHRLGWPPVEWLAGSFDVVHSDHPLLIPARRAAQVVTIHDLHFLSHPEHTRAEVRRDYPALARPHAQRADAIIVPSEYTAAEVERRLDVPRARIAICPPGAPDWQPCFTPPERGYILYFGTLEPRKNIGTLLDAYERLVTGEGAASIPDLVLAGHAPPVARPWLDRIARPPLAGRVRHLGYVDDADRRGVYEGARLLLHPSFEEGFGMSVLEAMTLGIPVVAANRGAMPEVLGDAGQLVDAEDSLAMATAVRRVLGDAALSASCASGGITRARQFRWLSTAARVVEAYHLAIDHRANRRGAA